MRRLFALLSIAALAACEPAEESLEPLYDSAEVETRDIEATVEAAGVVEPVTTVEVKSKASGEVLTVNAETGDLVESGALLVSIDRRALNNRLAEVEAALVAAQARRRIAQTQMERAGKLFETKTLTQADYEQTQLEFAQAESQVVSARVAVENARITLEDAEVRAPITGTVIEKTVERGTVISSPTQAVSDGTVLMKMADLTSVQVRARVDETDIGKIVPGMRARVVVAAYPNQPFDGEVLKIEPLAIVEQNVTMFAVLINIANRGGLLKPGMNAEVEIEIQDREGVLVLPTAALRAESDIPVSATMLGMEENELRVMLGLPPIDENELGGTLVIGDREIQLPDDVSVGQARELIAKRRGGESLGRQEQALLERIFQNNGGGRGGWGGRGGGGGGGDFAGRSGGGFQGGPPNGSFPGSERNESVTGYQFGGDYWVLAIRNDELLPVMVRTGLTDLEYSEIVSGLTADDKVLLLPTTSLYEQQAQLQEFISQRFGSGSPFQQNRGGGGGGGRWR